MSSQTTRPLRHSLIWLQPEAYTGLNLNLISQLSVPPLKYSAEKLSNILKYENSYMPAIVRRPVRDLDDATLLPVGFVLPRRKNGMRVRIATGVRKGQINKVVSPFQLTSHIPEEVSGLIDRPAMKVLHQLQPLLKEYVWGVWGSAALALATGIPFDDGDSDVDLLLKCVKGEKQAATFLEIVNWVANNYNMKIDIEVFLEDGSGINLRELLSGSSQVMIKGGSGLVSLVSTAEAWRLCCGQGLC